MLLVPLQLSVRLVLCCVLRLLLYVVEERVVLELRRAHVVIDAPWTHTHTHTHKLACVDTCTSQHRIDLICDIHSTVRAACMCMCIARTFVHASLWPHQVAPSLTDQTYTHTHTHTHMYQYHMRAMRTQLTSTWHMSHVTCTWRTDHVWHTCLARVCSCL